MTDPNMEKVWQEIEDLRKLPALTIEIPLLAAMEIVGYIQFCTKDPAREESEFGKMAIEVARKLQDYFDPNSECFKLLQFGWELQAGIRDIECGRHQDGVKVQELKQRVFDIFGIPDGDQS